MSFSFRALHAQLQAAASRISFADKYDKLREEADIPLPRDATALLDRLHSKGPSPSWKNAVLRALILCAKRETHAETAVTLVLLALWPGLAVLRFRLRRCKSDMSVDLDGELVGRMALAIRTLDPERVDRIAATLLMNLERDMRRDSRRKGRETLQGDPAAGDTTPLWSPASPSDADTSRGFLLAELEHLIGTDARLVLEVAVDGASQAEAAISLGISHDAARKRYQRARARLRDLF